jgi:hypothetical protein
MCVHDSSQQHDGIPIYCERVEHLPFQFNQSKQTGLKGRLTEVTSRSRPTVGMIDALKTPPTQDALDFTGDVKLLQQTALAHCQNSGF